MQRISVSMPSTVLDVVSAIRAAAKKRQEELRANDDDNDDDAGDRHEKAPHAVGYGERQGHHDVASSLGPKGEEQHVAAEQLGAAEEPATKLRCTAKPPSTKLMRCTAKPRAKSSSSSGRTRGQLVTLAREHDSLNDAVDEVQAALVDITASARAGASDEASVTNQCEQFQAANASLRDSLRRIAAALPPL